MKLLNPLALAAFSVCALLTVPAVATPPGIPLAINTFITKLFPNASHYYWVVNNAQTETDTEMILDLNAFITDKSDGKSFENRYLLLILDGKILAAQHIPLNSKVDCGKDKEV